MNIMLKKFLGIFVLLCTVHCTIYLLLTINRLPTIRRLYWIILDNFVVGHHKDHHRDDYC